MRLFRRAFWLVLLPLLFSAEVRADNCCPQYYDDCCYNDCCDWCSDWTVYGDYLYWRARRCDLDYVITGDVTNNQVNGNVRSVEPTYDSGFRVGAMKECGKRFFGLEYTYFRNQEGSKAIGSDFSATRTVGNAPRGVNPASFDFAKADWNIDYDVVDLFGGYTIRSRNCFEAYVFGGFRYASIDQKLKTFYAENADTSGRATRIRQEIDMDAYGVDLGIGARYEFCNCFNLFGSFSYDALVADFERKYVYDYRNTGGFLNYANFHDDCWYVVGVINLSFGLGYEFDFCGCWVDTIGLAIGYEFHQWLNQPGFLDFRSDDLESTFDHHLQSLGFDGLFVRLSLGF